MLALGCHVPVAAIGWSLPTVPVGETAKGGLLHGNVSDLRHRHVWYATGRIRRCR